MTLNVKDSENPAAPPAPAAPSASVTKSPAEAPARPQPVALEVPVTVNGARTVEGSDKREPFSEKSATVLVFGHGAVIRVSTLLAPGQLVFLTNEKTKKEVVCQVVKSKTDGNAVGYVELRFTEPAPGFWGMRFPSDTVLPQAAPRPAAPAPAPAAPKVAPPVPGAPPVAVQPAAPMPPAPAKLVIPAPPAPIAPISPVAAAPEVPSTPAPSIVSAPQAVEPKVSFPTPPPPAAFEAPQIATHTESPIPPAIVEAPPAPVASAPVSPVIESKPVAPITSAPVSSSGPSTEELKQQAARLQEQLSSLLFTEAPKPTAPVSAPSSSATETVNAPDVAQKVFELASVAPETAPAKPVKSVPPQQPKPASSSLEVEEIKIPSWLAPLARESETPAPSASSFHVEGTNSDVESVIPPAPQEVILAEAQESSRRPETAVFGGQLLGESSQPAEAPASKSKAGMFVGIAASLLLVAGGVWYSRQPGNALSAMLSGGGSKPEHAVSAPAVTNRSEEPAPAPVAAASAPAPVPSRMNPPAESTPVPSVPVDHAPRSANPVPAPATRNVQPAVEEPKKPSLGDVHLATPVINPGTAASSSSADPALEINSSANTSTPVSALGGSHRAEPVAPAPVGGDVKPAKLVKSVPPVYPELARNQRISGNVQIDALIDADGNVSSMKVLSGPPLLHQAALDALKQWKYQPAELDGKATSMHLTVTIQFRTQ